MGFRKQPNRWQCGPYALMHALIIMGVLVDEKELSQLTGTDASGTDEAQLGRAARRLGCRLGSVRRHTPDEARRVLVRYLRRGIPCLICVYNWNHWVTVVKEERGKFILLDSEDGSVLTIVSWGELARNWVYHRRKKEIDDASPADVYDIHPLTPRFRVRSRARFSVARARFLRRPENRELAYRWDEYLSDLLVLCRPATKQESDAISFREFARRYGEMIVDQVTFWHGGVGRSQASRVLQNMRFVATTHGLVIPRGEVRRAIAGLTAIMTLWAGGRYGVLPVYGTPPPASKKA
jgi:Peptidase C39 family